MNKSKLAAIMAEKASLSKKDAEGALNAFVDAVKDAVKKSDKVQLVGFGTFESRKRRSKRRQKPADGRKNQNCRVQLAGIQARQRLQGLHKLRKTRENHNILQFQII